VIGASELNGMSLDVESCGINIGGDAIEEPMLVHSPFGPACAGGALVDVLAGQACVGAAAVVVVGDVFDELGHGGGWVRAFTLVDGAAAGWVNGLVNRG
jgi:hypothetical protein